MSGESDAVRLEATWGDFVANVSHELKTPVGAVALLAEAVLHVAANHGGDVQLWSKPGTGSRFTLRIPAHPDSPQHSSRTPSTLEYARGRDDLVLIAEESGSIADMLTFLLNKEASSRITGKQRTTISPW